MLQKFMGNDLSGGRKRLVEFTKDMFAVVCVNKTKKKKKFRDIQIKFIRSQNEL